MRRLLVCLALIVLAGCGAPTPGSGMPPAQSPRTPVAEGGMCGGFAGFQCEGGLTCQTEVTACRRVADAAGVCRRRPAVCPMIYQPVCGCDGKTYGNACQAAGAGVNTASTGACQT